MCGQHEAGDTACGRAMCRYDFGYLMKLLTCLPLPSDESEFFELLGLYFPNFFDMKYLCKFCDNLHGGLNKLAELLDVQRIGPQHQAGSDRCGKEDAAYRGVRTAANGGKRSSLLDQNWTWFWPQVG
eukprot:356225-Chlamydomonas_euryale.AAC.16